MSIIYAQQPDLTAEEFQTILISSRLAERRPVYDLKRLDHMLRQADIIITARDADKLVDISRAITE